MNITLEDGKPIAGGGDGAFINISVMSEMKRVNGMLRLSTNATTAVRSFEGAEPRPLGVTLYPRPRVRRAAWPTTLAACAVVLALDHGNGGAAAIVVLWWLGWAVGR